MNSLTGSVEIFGTVGTAMSISNSLFRSGNYAFRCSGLVSGTNSAVQLALPSALDTGFYRTYFYVTTLPTAANTFLRFNDNSNNTRVRMTVDSLGVIRLLATGTTVGPTLLPGFWYCLEVQIDRSGGAGAAIVKCRVNGGGEFGVSTNTLSTGIQRMWLCGNGAPGAPEAQTQGDWSFDDVAINDNTGSFQNWYPGDGKIIMLSPNAAGDVNTFATQTGGTAGASNNFTRVSDVTPDDATTFNGSSTLNEEDLMNCTDSGIASNAKVNVVCVGGRFRNSTADATAGFKFEAEKTGSGTKSLSAEIVPNSTTFKSNNTNSNPNPYPITLYQDPDGNPWTQTTLDSMQIGYKLTTGPGTAGRRIDVSQVCAMVDYTIPQPINPLLFGAHL